MDTQRAFDIVLELAEANCLDNNYSPEELDEDLIQQAMQQRLAIDMVHDFIDMHDETVQKLHIVTAIALELLNLINVNPNDPCTFNKLKHLRALLNASEN